MNKKIMLWIMTTILLVNIAFALGIRPAKRNLDFAPEGEVESSFVILNNENKEFVAKVYANDILKEYIEFEETEFKFEAGEDLKEVKYKLKFPSELTPGENVGKIIVEESLPPNPRDISIAAKLMIMHTVHVISPTPTKYVKAQIDYEDQGDDVEIVTNVTNEGTGKIESLKSVVEIYDGEAKIKTLETSTESLDPSENKNLPVYFEKEGKEAGEYRILAAVEYDNERLEMTKYMYIGEPSVNILRYDKYLVEGEVNEFKFDIKSNWNKLIERVTAIITVLKDSGEVELANIPAFDIGPLEEKTVSAYLDLRQFLAGDYDFNVKVSYFNKTEEANFKAVIINAEEREKRNIREERRIKEEGSKAVIFLVVGIVVAVVLVVFSFVMMFAARRKGGGGISGTANTKTQPISGGGW